MVAFSTLPWALLLTNLVTFTAFKINRLKVDSHIHFISPSDVQSPTSKSESYSFVQDDLRAYAMKLHTRDQAPKEGKQPAEKPFTTWVMRRIHYVQVRFYFTIFSLFYFPLILQYSPYSIFL
jgi:hypothetical protein